MSILLLLRNKSAVVTVTVPGAAVAAGAGKVSPAEVDIAMSYTIR